MISQCYVADELQAELKAWYNYFNELSKKNTYYEIRPGNPTASLICAKILKEVRNNLVKCDMNVNKVSKFSKMIEIAGEIKCNISLQVDLNKIKGVKRNDIEI
jgi:hypothetical protein